MDIDGIRDQVENVGRYVEQQPQFAGEERSLIRAIVPSRPAMVYGHQLLRCASYVYDRMYGTAETQ
jgi:hypothetical protein